MGFELGFEKKQFAGKWDQDLPPWLKSKNNKCTKLGRRRKVFFCHKMNKSASTGGFSLPKEFFVKVYENK